MDGIDLMIKLKFIVQRFTTEVPYTAVTYYVVYETIINCNGITEQVNNRRLKNTFLFAD